MRNCYRLEVISKTESVAQKEKTETAKGSHDHKHRYAWAELLKRVFAVDALKCTRCGFSARSIRLMRYGKYLIVSDCRADRRQYPLRLYGTKTSNLYRSQVNQPIQSIP